MNIWPKSVVEAPCASIFFARSASAVQAGDLPHPSVVVVADANSFNNFGKRYWAELYIVPTDGSLIHTPMMIMFEGEKDSHAFLHGIFSTKDEKIFPIVELDRPFVTLFNGLEGYACLLEALGFEVAISTLRALGDAVVLRVEEMLEDERQPMLLTPAFHEGILRSREAYAAFRRGARLLRPEPASPSADAQGVFRFQARLPAIEQAIDVRFDYTPHELFQDRICVLIGRNGMGKTQIVRSMVEGLKSHPEAFDPHVERAHFAERPSLFRVLLLSSVASDSHPRSIPAWSGVDYEYLSLTAQPQDRSDALMVHLLDCTRDAGDLHFRFRGVRLDRHALLKQIVDILGFWEDLYVPLRPATVGEDDMFDAATMVDGVRYWPIARHLNERRAVRLVESADFHRSCVVLDKDGAVRQLSSGETSLLRFAVQSVSAIETGSLLILEEPETYLHPNFVSQLMDILQDLLEATGSVALILTHSAYVVREVQRARVQVVRRPEANIVEMRPAPIQTFGASIDAISQFVFGDATIPHRFEETLRRWIENNPDVPIEEIAERYAGDLNPETLSFMAGVIRGDEAFARGNENS